MAYTRLNLTNGTKLDETHLKHIEDGIVNNNIISVQPTIDLGGLKSTGEFQPKWYDRVFYRTPKYLYVLQNSVTITASVDCVIRIFEYDKTFSCLTYQDYSAFSANVAKSVTLSEGTNYIRLAISKDKTFATNFGLPVITINGISNEEFFNIRPSDEGYLRLVIPINVVNPNASDEETYAVQDQMELMPDYGILVLPKNYSNIGKPTRLIIYCHGAAVHYTESSTRFVETDCDPNYWLAEGYAIMDMHGNPFDATHPHIYIPQARQAYLAGYNWVINNFNICRDGIFLGGRSMGGGTVFELLRTNLPVIAACPLACVTNTLYHWSILNPSRKTFLAEHMGFKGTQPSWTNVATLSEEELQYLDNNFDKLVQCSAIYEGIDNLPDKEDLINASKGISPNTTSDENEAAFFNKLRYKAKAPIKIFCAKEDTSAPYLRNAVYMQRMLTNAGCVNELRLFSTDASNAHRFELSDSRAYVNHTTIFGEVVSAPVAYIEMLQFWRRYEKTV